MITSQLHMHSRGQRVFFAFDECIEVDIQKVTYVIKWKILTSTTQRALPDISDLLDNHVGFS